MVVLSRLTYFIAVEIWNFVHKTNDRLIKLLCWFDSGWYADIARYGYMPEPMAHVKGDAANWAFFPLYPCLVALISRITSLDIEIAGVGLSTIFLVIAALFIGKYIRLTRKESAAPSAIILLAFGPYSFYFSSLYTEALFVLLTALCFYYMQKEKWLVCGILGALLSATRPTGIVFEVVLIARLIELEAKRGKNLMGVLVDIVADDKKRLSLLLVPAGLLSYMTFLYSYVGDPLAFKHVEVAWGREFDNPFKLFYLAVTGDGRSIYLALWEALGLMGVGFLYVQKRYAECVFALFCVILPATTSLIGMPRYIVGSLMLPLAFNDFLNRYGNWKWSVIGALSVGNMYLLFLWFSRHPVTM